MIEPGDSSQTYYDILGVPATARLVEIKQAFHQLARQYHPDLHPNDPDALAIFQTMSHAYQVLSDPVARSHYDQTVLGIQGDAIHNTTDTTANTHTAAEFYQQGLQLSQRGKYLEAIAAYTQAISLNPTLADAYNQRGFAHYKLNQSSKAFSDYAEAIRRDTQQATSFYYRGLTRFKLGYTESAITDYTQAIALNPQHSQSYYHRGLAHLDIKDLAAAESDFKRAEAQFIKQGDVHRSRDAQRAYEQLVYRQSSTKLIQTLSITPSDTLMVVLRIFCNPLGGSVAAFDRLTPQRAGLVGVLLGAWFDLCFVYGMVSLAALNITITPLFVLFVVSLGLFPFILLAFSSSVGRVIFSQHGSLWSDLFMAGVALTPLSLLALGVSNVSFVTALILGCAGLGHMGLSLYGGCRYILRFQSLNAAVWVLIMIGMALLPLLIAY